MEVNDKKQSKTLLLPEPPTFLMKHPPPSYPSPTLPKSFTQSFRSPSSLNGASSYNPNSFRERRLLRRSKSFEGAGLNTFSSWLPPSKKQFAEDSTRTKRSFFTSKSRSLCNIEQPMIAERKLKRVALSASDPCPTDCPSEVVLLKPMSSLTPLTPLNSNTLAATLKN